MAEPPGYDDPLVAAQPWDWWIAVELTLAGVGAVLALVFGYLYKVVAPQYPRRGQQRQQK